MASWSDIEGQVPELAAEARAFFDAFGHKTMATLRRDGSPRISGTEVNFTEGELYIGSMWRSLKALDLQRDPRFALHSGSAEPDAWKGDAKVAGRMEEITDPQKVREINGEAVGPSHLFRADISELAVVRMERPEGEEPLIAVVSWHEGRGITELRRR